ncbi:MAG TPA: zf-HC2 domain-containing protein [Terriglobia bacterium]|jgi:anti-sigma factor RsiW
MSDEGDMQHVSADDILTYLDGKASDARQSALEAHLAVCAGCAEEKKQFQALEFRLRQEPRFEPPADAVQAWIDLFPGPLQKPKSPLRQIIASLVFDTFDQPLLAGVRSHGGALRPSMYRAGAAGLDVKIEVTEANERITIAGQLFSGVAHFLDNTNVALESGGILRYQTRTNETGEFSFDVPADTYHLLIDLPEDQVRILSVHPRNSREQ